MNTEVILYFVRKYYVLDCHYTADKYPSMYQTKRPVNLVIRDWSDVGMEGQVIPISVIKDKEITFLWGFGKKITGIDLYNKKWAHELPGKIMHSFRHERTQDFFRLLLNEKIPCVIPISEIPLEFPNLFSDGLQKAVKIGKT